MHLTDVSPPSTQTQARAPRPAEQRRKAPPARREDLAPPPWVGRLLGGSQPAEHFVASAAPFTVRVTDSSHFSLVSARVSGAVGMDDAAFERCAAEAYRSVAQVVRARPRRHPVRLWNHLPDIRRASDDGAGRPVDRYMVFNAGRFAACSEWLGGPDAFDRTLPTASAVGHDGPDLVVHALAGDDAGLAVENPRQVPPYRYSKRFGPRPPCFARATVLTDIGSDEPLVLVGGTASIRGEESMHLGDVRAQTLETFENLSVLLRTACGAVGRPIPAAYPNGAARHHFTQPALRSFDALRGFHDLRVYYVRPEDLSVIRRLVAVAFPHLAEVEYVRADLCRPELLVEIEGTAGSPHER